MRCCQCAGEKRRFGVCQKIGMESNLFDLQVNGDINLGTEKMNLKVDVSPRSEGILEAVFNSVSIGGTLALPSVRVNAEKRLTGLCLWEWRFLWAEKKPQKNWFVRKR